MPIPPASPAPKNFQVSDQQQAGQFEAQAQELIQKHNVDPGLLAKIGDMAFAAIKDKAMYPMVKDAIVKNKLAKPEQLQQGLDYKMLANFVMIGKVAKKLAGGM